MTEISGDKITNERKYGTKDEANQIDPQRLK